MPVNVIPAYPVEPDSVQQFQRPGVNFRKTPVEVRRQAPVQVNVVHPPRPLVGKINIEYGRPCPVFLQPQKAVGYYGSGPGENAVIRNSVIVNINECQFPRGFAVRAETEEQVEYLIFQPLKQAQNTKE